MIKCKTCGMLKIDEKSKCACNVKRYDEKKLFKEKPIAQVSEKKQERIKESGSEIQLFKNIFSKLKKKNQNICQVCKVKVNEDEVN